MVDWTCWEPGTAPMMVIWLFRMLGRDCHPHPLRKLPWGSRNHRLHISPGILLLPKESSPRVCSTTPRSVHKARWPWARSRRCIRRRGCCNRTSLTVLRWMGRGSCGRRSRAHRRWRRSTRRRPAAPPSPGCPGSLVPRNPPRPPLPPARPSLVWLRWHCRRA